MERDDSMEMRGRRDDEGMIEEEEFAVVNETTSGDEEYGLTERQLAFKLLASHAMVDPDFYAELRADPAGAAAKLHISLDDEDFRYISEVVEWDSLDQHAEEVRRALHADQVVRSIW